MFMSKIKFYFFIFLFFNLLKGYGITKDSYFEEGRKLYNESKFSKSRFKFEQDIVFNPKNEKSYLYLAKIFKKEKKDDQEEQNLNTVLLLNPQNEEAIYLLTLLKIKKSDYDKSSNLIKNFKKVCNVLCEKETELNQKLKSLQTK